MNVGVLRCCPGGSAIKPRSITHHGRRSGAYHLGMEAWPSRTAETAVHQLCGCPGCFNHPQSTLVKVITKVIKLSTRIQSSPRTPRNRSAHQAWPTPSIFPRPGSTASQFNVACVLAQLLASPPIAQGSLLGGSTCRLHPMWVIKMNSPRMPVHSKPNPVACGMHLRNLQPSPNPGVTLEIPTPQGLTPSIPMVHGVMTGRYATKMNGQNPFQNC